MNLEWMYVDYFSAHSRGQTVSAASSMDTATTQVHIKNTFETNIHPPKTHTQKKKTSKCTETTRSLASRTIALCFIYPELH